MDDNKIRKLIWERKDAADAKMAEPGFDALPADERDAWILCLQLDVPFDQAAACVGGTADAGAMENVRARIAEAFQYGKRKALRALKEALGRHPSLNVPQEEAGA